MNRQLNQQSFFDSQICESDPDTTKIKLFDNPEEKTRNYDTPNPHGEPDRFLIRLDFSCQSPKHSENPINKHS